MQYLQIENSCLGTGSTLKFKLSNVIYDYNKIPTATPLFWSHQYDWKNAHTVKCKESGNLQIKDCSH